MGIVYESFRINMNQIFWDFWPYKLNPQYKSFKNRSTNRIHVSNLLNIVGQNKSTKWILGKQYGFANPKLRICMDSGMFKVHLYTKDSSGFIRICSIRENRSNLWNSGHKSNPQIWIFKVFGLANPDSQIYEVGFVNHDTNQTFLESGFVTMIQNKSMFLQISYTIPATLWKTLK